MNYVRQNPVGIDSPIEKIKKSLYDYLSGLGRIDAYGRVYLNQRGKKKVLEAYVGKNEYEEVMGTDRSTFFFYVEPEDAFNEDPQAKVNIVFTIDLNHFYNVDDRNDENFKLSVLSILDSGRFETTMLYRDESYLKRLLRNSGIKHSYNFDNMHPKMIFSVQGKVNYKYKICL